MGCIHCSGRGPKLEVVAARWQTDLQLLTLEPFVMTEVYTGDKREGLKKLYL